VHPLDSVVPKIRERLPLKTHYREHNNVGVLGAYKTVRIYLVCYKEVRTLKVARIKGLTRLEKCFEKLEDFSLAEHFRDWFGVFSSQRQKSRSSLRAGRRRTSGRCSGIRARRSSKTANTRSWPHSTWATRSSSSGGCWASDDMHVYWPQRGWQRTRRGTC